MNSAVRLKTTVETDGELHLSKNCLVVAGTKSKRSFAFWSWRRALGTGSERELERAAAAPGPDILHSPARLRFTQLAAFPFPR